MYRFNEGDRYHMNRYRMKKLSTIILTVSLFFLIVWGIWFLIKEPSYDDNISIDLISGCVLFLSFLVALNTYLGSRKRDEQLLAEKRREYFITNNEFKEIRMLIEHNDIELQTMIAITNIMEWRKPGFFSKEMMRLHENFDSCVTYMESIAILANQDGIATESLKGYWSYYFKRLRGIHLLDFDDPNHPVLIENINQCIDNFYEDNTDAADAIKAEFQKHISSQESESTKHKRGAKPAAYTDPIELRYKSREARINPVSRPIWHYINSPEYEFGAITKLCRNKFYKKNDSDIELRFAGF